MFGGQGKINGSGGMLKLPSDNTFPGNARNPENQIAKLYFENKFVLPSVLPGKCRQKFDMIYICIMCLVPLLVQLQICSLNSHLPILANQDLKAEASRYCTKCVIKMLPGVYNCCNVISI